MARARNFGDRPEAGQAGELGIINLMSIFFLWVREFFVLHRMVGRTWRGVLTPGYFEPCNFPSGEIYMYISIYIYIYIYLICFAI